MATLSLRLAEHGWRMTAQRRVIASVFDAVGEHHIHLTADEVLARCLAKLPDISRATVYNTLGELVDAGELRQVSVGDRITRYDPNVAEHHHHLVCRQCGAIFDLPAGTGGSYPLPALTDFQIESAEIVYRGLCRNCS